MKTLYLRTALTALALATATTTSPAQLQTQATQQPPDSVVAVVADALGLPFVPPDQRQFFGTYWGVRSSLPCITAPLPCPPLDPNTPVYAIGDPVAGGQFLVDETAGQVISPHAQSSRRLLSTMDSASTLRAQVDELQNFIAQTQARQAEALLRANGQMDALALDGQDGGGVFGPMGLDSYTASDLWLSISQITNGVAPLVIHGTLQDVTYEILSRQTLTDTIWTSETNVQGAADQDWTPTRVAVGSRTNALFLWCRSWVSSNGSGIPDWWQLQYFGHTGVDPYADPDGDGWSNFQEFQNGTSPTLCDTPPTPRQLTVAYYGSNNVVVAWNPSPGQVNSYIVERVIPELDETNYFTFAASVTTFQDSLPSQADPNFELPPTYRMMAQYSCANSGWSGRAPLLDPSITPAATIVPGPQGVPYLVVSALPANVSFIRVERRVSSYFWDACYPEDQEANFLWEDPWAFDSGLTDGWFDIPASSFTNGVCRLPTAEAPPFGTYKYDIQPMGLDGRQGQHTLVSPYSLAPWYWSGGRVVPFMDGREQIKQNVEFLLRAARGPYLDGSTTPFSVSFSRSGGTRNCLRPGNDDYVWAGFQYMDHTAGGDTLVVDPFQPFEQNYFYLNFVFSSTNVTTNGDFTTGATFNSTIFDRDYYGAVSPANLFSTYNYLHSQRGSIPAVLPSSPNQSWFYVGIVGLESLGRIHTPDYGYVIPTDWRNQYGLLLNSIKWPGPQQPYAFPTAVPGDSITLAGSGWTLSTFFFEMDYPQLTNVSYYFARPSVDPRPEEADFRVDLASPTNIILPFGQPSFVTAYAKQAILNGYADKFAFAQQYFEAAYRMNSSGNATTNQTGVLSPYGDFLPTEPGGIALVTMPDGATGQRGTGVVNVIKLQTDVDHNGFMDLSFGGPDNTSQARPALMWVNSDCDWATRTLFGNPSEVGHDISVLGGGISPNYDYRDIAIRSQRDLEDYARLWICGVPALTNGGYQVTLSLANASTTTFAINLVNAVEADGGTGYLTDTNIAAAQVAYSDHTSPGYKFARLTTSQPYTFPDNYFTNNATKHFLFEGAGIGSGQLVLTVSQATAQGTNVLAQTSMWLDLRDVKNMYEQVHISGVTNAVPPTSGFLSSSYQQLNWVDAGSDGDTNIIVFVHGWRMGVWDYENFSESMFKRLYWQGYRGRFVSIRWDTLSKDDFKFASTLQSYTSYNSSEYRAWESAKGVSDYLTSLKQRFPNYNLNVCAHSMGNVVMAEALKLQLAAGQHNVNNYVLMQAAVPASCYDTSFTNYAPMLAAEASQPTPNVYLGYPGAISGAVSGHLFDFFNTNDFALATGTIYIPLYGNKLVSWEGNQEDYKPDSGFNYTTDGTNSWNLGFFPTKLITDSHEVMSFCARPRSKAVGAQPNVGGVILTTGQVDLTGAFHFLGNWDEHSAEFNWSIHRLNGFYHTLLNTLIPPGQ